MFNLVRSDLYKTTHSKIFWILLTITIACSIAMFSISYGIGNNSLNMSLGSVGFLISDMNMMTIIGAVLATFLICSDFDTKNIHHPIISGYSRMQIVVSKAIVFWILLFTLAIPFIVVTFIGLTMDTTFSMGGVAAGYLSILTTSTSGTFGQSIVILLIMTMVYFAQLCVCLLLAFTLRKAVLVVAGYYMLSMFLGQVASFPETFELLHNIISYTPFAGKYITMHVGMSSADLTIALFTCMIFMLVVMWLTYMSFRKAEIK
ncbi:hypothetical protein [Solibacillus sp. CAU 1738]|uniref:hypothetical protein n=1 Tax=Solibacillus sp. CAU 1738 TaxID=3140363 RepID=UPI003260272E